MKFISAFVINYFQFLFHVFVPLVAPKKKVFFFFLLSLKNNQSLTWKNKSKSKSNKYLYNYKNKIKKNQTNNTPWFVLSYDLTYFDFPAMTS